MTSVLSSNQSAQAALTHLRIPFSVYLMPVYWMAISHGYFVVDIWKAVAVFICIHLFVYPASNGYNSWYDQDEGSIGGLETPPPVPAQLYKWVLIFDLIGFLLALWIGWVFALLLLGYVLASKAYSYPKVRLKKYPFISTLTVVFFQGAYTYLMVQAGSINNPLTEPFLLSHYNMSVAITASLFLIASYPLTQIYQHDEDSRRGDHTLSLKLGINGTFAWSSLWFAVSTAWLVYTYLSLGETETWRAIIFLVGGGPVLAVFGFWVWQYNQGQEVVNFKRAMLMNQVSSLTLSAVFVGQMLVDIFI